MARSLGSRRCLRVLRVTCAALVGRAALKRNHAQSASNHELERPCARGASRRTTRLFACQAVGLKDVHEDIWLVSFMIRNTSIWRLECWNRWKIPSAQKCYLCLRYEVSPRAVARQLLNAMTAYAVPMLER